MKDKAVSYLTADADQAAFLVGEIPGRQMKVYLTFSRSSYGVLRPFGSDPYYVAVTPDESFALDPAKGGRAGDLRPGQDRLAVHHRWPPC